MSKKMYYLLKEILPDFLLSILLILVFDVLNYKIEVASSIYVIYFAIWFTLLNRFLSGIISIIQITQVKKISISDIISNKTNKVFKFIIFFKIIKTIATTLSFVLISLLYKDKIIIDSIIIPIFMGIGIEILKLLLNIIFKFDKIIMLNSDQKQFDEELDDLIENIIKEEDMNKRFHLNEKNKKSSQDLDKLMKRTQDPIEKDEDENE